jgi:type VI secretion system protein VasI
MRILIFLSGVIAVVLIACSSSAPIPTKQPAVTSTPIPFRGLWLATQPVVDAITDEETVKLFNTAVSGQSEGGGAIYLGIECVPPTAMVEIVWKSFIGGNWRPAEVTWRLDSEDAISGEWSLDSVGDKVSLSEGEAESFVSDMLRHDQLIARVTSYSGNKLTATFDVRGLEEAIKPLYEGCPGLSPIN